MPGDRPEPTPRVGLALLLLPFVTVSAVGILLLGTAEWRSLVLAGALWSVSLWSVFQLVTAARSGRGRELLLLATALALSLGLAEAALRLLRPYDSLPRFRWIASSRYHHLNPPNARMFSGYVAGAPVLVLTNEDGLRSGHARSEFQGHAVRIAVLGDSFVFGPGVAMEQAFPARLEKRLREGGGAPDAAVLNAGVISYSPLLERRFFEGVVEAYRPTVVMLFLDVTDVGDDAIYAAKARGEEPSPFPLEGDDRIRYRGALFQLLEPYADWLLARVLYPVERVRARIGGARGPADSANYYLNFLTFEGHSENRYFIYRYPLERTRPFFDRTFKNVEAIAARTAALGARFVLVVLPRYHHWSQRECPRNWEIGPYKTDEPFQYEFFRFFEERKATAPFAILDLLPAFKATSEFPLVFPNDPHWNAEGHDFVARTMLQYLQAEGLAPSPRPPG